MPEKMDKMTLDDWLLRLHQNANIDYMAIIGAGGKIWAEAGSPGPISQGDVTQLLEKYFKMKEHMSPAEDFDEIRIVKQGAVECFIVPLDGNVQMIATASIERPSVLARLLINELLTARESITAMIKAENTIAETKENYTTEEKAQTANSEGSQNPSDAGALEELMSLSTNGTKTREASKYWDGASVDESGFTQNGKTISYDEAKRSGLVPEEKK